MSATLLNEFGMVWYGTTMVVVPRLNHGSFTGSFAMVRQPVTTWLYRGCFHRGRAYVRCAEVHANFTVLYGPTVRVATSHFPNPRRGVRGYHPRKFFRIPYAIWCILRQSGGSYL